MTVIEEVLSRPGESEKPLHDQECWILELLDCTQYFQGGFIVQQGRKRWSEIDGQFMLEDFETERWPLLMDAEERYEARRLALMKKGFVHSDMDF